MEEITFFDLPDIILEKIAGYLIIDDIANLAEINPKASYLVNYCRGGLSLKYVDKKSNAVVERYVGDICGTYRNVMEYAFKPIILIDVFKYICVSQDSKLLDILLERNAFRMIADSYPKIMRLLMKYCIQYIAFSLAINKGQLFKHIYKSFKLNNNDLVILWKNIKQLYTTIEVACVHNFQYIGHYKIILESVLQDLVLTYGLRIKYVPKDQRDIIKKWIDDIANTAYYSRKREEVLQLICMP